MARILGRRGRDSNGVPINNLSIVSRSSLADSDNGITTNPASSNWQDIQPERVWYNTGGPGQLYGEWVAKPLDNWMLDPNGIATGVLNKGWRALILIKRGFGKPDDKAEKKGYDPATTNSPRVDKKKSNRESEVSRGKEIEDILSRNIYRLTGESRPSGDVFRFIGKDNLDQLPYKESDTHKSFKRWSRDNNNQIIIYNTSATPYEYIALQTRPLQVDFKGETSWATIKSMGRNTPIYQYTGAEDTLQFNISWYSTDLSNPDEVVNKCRLLESWSKSNGYLTAPPVLQIQWGNKEDYHMLVNHDYILISTTYSLKNFNNGARRRGDRNTWESYNLNLWPSIATQELVFKRVSSHNLGYEDILPSEKRALVVKKKT